MPWRVLGTQIRGVLRLAQFSRPSLCMPVDLLVFLISFLSQAGMCQRCAKVLIHSLIHLFTQTEYPTRQVIQVSYAIGLDSACKLGSPKFITSLKESTQSRHGRHDDSDWKPNYSVCIASCPGESGCAVEAQL